MRTVTTIIISFLLSSAALGQDFVAQSTLPGVSRDGFYKIPLSPGLLSCANTSLSNLRIVDGHDVQIPFIVSVEKQVAGVREFVPYDIEEKELLADSCTILVLRNHSNTVINNINLVIKNAAVLKEAALYGSDDKNTWYALKDKFTLGGIANESGTAEVRIIDFPASNYTYYKLWINDKNNAPLNILRAGYFKDVVQEASYGEVPISRVTREHDPEQKKSYLRISLDTFQLIDRISWNVSGIPFYQRTASLYTIRKRKDKRGAAIPYTFHITNIQLNSRHERIQHFPATKTNNLVLEVSDGDNPPLKIEDVKLYQANRYLVAWLKKNGSYTLRFGGAEMPAPDYDLELFRDSIPAALSVATPGKIQLIMPSSVPERTTVFTSKAFIWIALAVVMLALGIMSVKLIRGMKPMEE